MTRKKEREQASVDYQMSTRPAAIGGDALSDIVYRMNINPSFIAGAEWADKTMIDKACEYLINNIDKELTIYNNKTWKKRDEFIKDFKKAMEK